MEAAEGFASHKNLSCWHSTDYPGQVGITTNKTLVFSLFLVCIDCVEKCKSKPKFLLNLFCFLSHFSKSGWQETNRRRKAIKHKCTGQQVGFYHFQLFFSFLVGSRYNKDLFYISPLYGKAFAKLEKIIFIDMDLDFYGEWLWRALKRSKACNETETELDWCWKVLHLFYTFV